MTCPRCQSPLIPVQEWATNTASSMMQPYICSCDMCRMLHPTECYYRKTSVSYRKESYEPAKTES